MPPPAKTIEPFEELQATLLRLINCYAAHPCGRLATHISYQVEKLLGHPLIDLFPELRQPYAQSLPFRQDRFMGHLDRRLARRRMVIQRKKAIAGISIDDLVKPVRVGGCRE